MKFLFLYFGFSISFIGLYAQSNQKEFEFETKLHYGTILPHYSFLNYLVEEPQTAFEIQIRRTSNYAKVHSSLFRFPDYGIGYTHTSFGNRDILGYASSLFAVLDVPIFSSPTWALFYQCNFGAAYIYKPLSKSLFNIAMSSPFNFFIGIDLQVQYMFLNNHACRFGVDMSHVSNGKIHTPNLGLNSMTYTVSYLYSFSELCQDYTYYNRKKLTLPFMYSTIISGGLKTNEYLHSQLYPTSSLIFELQKIMWYTYGFTLGADLFYDASKTKSIHTGLHSGIEVYYLPFSFSMQIGMYTFHKSIEHNYFNRIALRYYTKQSYCIQLGLKTHGTTADFLEIGMGYQFPNLRSFAHDIQK